MEQFSIYEGHMDDLRKKVAKIQKKCAKFGCDFHYAEVGEEFKEVKVDETSEGKAVYGVRKFIIVEAEGTAQLNDWEFIASIEHTEKGNIFGKAMTAIEIPERYRNMMPTCEHCYSNRVRKTVFIVHNTVTDEFKMVGKSCLKDFTHGLSAEGATWFASLKTVFEEAEDYPMGSSCSWYSRFYNVEEVLHFVAETIRHFGYVKSDDSDATKTKFANLMDVYKGDTRFMTSESIAKYKALIESTGFNPESDEAKQMVADALNWINEQEASNDYMHNLKTVSSLDYTHAGNFGLLVSLFPTYNRELEREAQRRLEAEQGKSSEWVGNVGDKLVVEIEKVKCLTSWESNYGYYPTITYLWEIIGKDGNVYIWKSSNSIPDEAKSLKGTVKEHKSFRTVKQTELTRCRVS